MAYTPGLHLLINFSSQETDKLNHSTYWLDFIEEQIIILNLECVGKISHNFENGGFTAVHALTESHISIHTWPEYNFCTCDIFLSNFKKDNHWKVREFGQKILAFYNANDPEVKEVIR